MSASFHGSGKVVHLPTARAPRVEGFGFVRRPYCFGLDRMVREVKEVSDLGVQNISRACSAWVLLCNSWLPASPVAVAPSS